jgi:hypothetical protein
MDRSSEDPVGRSHPAGLHRQGRWKTTAVSHRLPCHFNGGTGGMHASIYSPMWSEVFKNGTFEFHWCLSLDRSQIRKAGSDAGDKSGSSRRKE